MAASSTDIEVFAGAPAAEPPRPRVLLVGASLASGAAAMVVLALVAVYARMRADVRPPSSLQAFLEEVAELSQAGLISRSGLPRRPSALVRAAAIAQRHRDMVTLLFPPMPPPLVQRVLFPPLARIARD